MLPNMSIDNDKFNNNNNNMFASCSCSLKWGFYIVSIVLHHSSIVVVSLYYFHTSKHDALRLTLYNILVDWSTYECQSELYYAYVVTVQVCIKNWRIVQLSDSQLSQNRITIFFSWVYAATAIIFIALLLIIIFLAYQEYKLTTTIKGGLTDKILYFFDITE